VDTSRFPIAAGGLIVSCQAPVSSPLYGPSPMALMAQAVIRGGAHAIRANGPADVAAIRAAVSQPIVGLHKIGDPSGVFITPSVAAAAPVVRAGADLLAIDGTTRLRPDGSTCAAQIQAIQAELGVLVVADVDCLEAGLRARDAGADAVATTLAGYTCQASTPDEPDIALVSDLAAAVDCPVFAEGRYRTATHVRAALDAGAHAVVVGAAITNPVAITQRLVHEIALSAGPVPGRTP
jgi:N-acylglucosamine-6-phosphate 2-epimerase